MKRSFLTFVAFTLLLLVASCSPKHARRVVILSTNDIHGAIQQFPRLATAIAECRDTVEVILADAGDRWTGNAYVDKAEQKCLPVIELMNRVGYDVATLGNHEFDYGQELLRERISQADFQIVCANMESCGSELTVPATTIIERGGIKFGFVGLITNFADGYPDGQKSNFDGLKFYSPFEKAVEMQSLKEQCDVLVLISHLGDDMDRVLTVDATEFDMIVGGHTHAIMPEGLDYNETLITQTGKSLKNLGVTVVEMQGNKITRLENRLVALADYAEDEEMKAAVEVYYKDPYLSAPIGSSKIQLSKVGLANFMAEAITKRSKSDVGLYHFGGVRIDSLRKYGISIGDIFTLEPFSSTIYTAQMTTEQIRGMIINKFNDSVNPKESHRPDINPYGTSYTIVTDAEGEAIDVKFSTLREGRTYKVAMGDYMYKNYNFDKSGEHNATGILVTEVLLDELRHHSPLKYTNEDRISIVEE